MTEWNAAGYDRIAGLQKAMAEEVLDRLPLGGSEAVLDVGCGDGKITAEVASRLPKGRAVGVDASQAMIAFAREHFLPGPHRNLNFEVRDARRLEFQAAFDQVISFNAIHWIHEQDQVLRALRSALLPGGRIHLRLVCLGPRRSLEDVIEETAHQGRWAAAFAGIAPPYEHREPEAYAAMALQEDLSVESVNRSDHCWNFGEPESFQAFARVTFVEWTRRLPEPDRAEFITEVLERYRPVACSRPGEEHCFKFFQLDLALRRPG